METAFGLIGLTALVLGPLFYRSFIVEPRRLRAIRIQKTEETVRIGRRAHHLDVAP
jgi:hypothetical protein